MKFHHISLRVRDFGRSMHFYKTLVGLEVVKQFEANGGNVAYLANAAGETEIELIAMPEGQNFEGKGFFLCFASDDLEAVHAVAAAEGMNPSDIRNPEPTAKYFYVYDPDGVSVQFREYKWTVTHYMKLNPEPFLKIACGYKTIELRLNDEKRQAVRVGDRIVFEITDGSGQTLETEVTALHHFADFAELYEALPLDRCGYLPEELESASPADMEAYYSLEKQEKYGVLGIGVRIV